MTVSLAWVALVAAILAARPLEAANADVTLEDGVYQGIVLGVDPATPEPEDGSVFLDQIKTFLQDGSEALQSALGASFGDVKLVLPRSWDKSRFGVTVLPAEKDLTIASADILLHDIVDTLPSTLQSESCGVPGRQIELPISFLSLTSEEENIYGTTGSIMAHEWAHYRYGVHDEHGYTNDLVYPPAYGDDNSVTGCFDGELTGAWRRECDSDATCRPNNEDCYFCINDTDTANSVRASLGYLPALSSGKFCDALTHNRNAPTPQNLLCGSRSVMEVIRFHPDHESMTGSGSLQNIIINVYDEPLGRVMLLLDTPPDTGEVLSYAVLLSNLQASLTQFSSLSVSMVSFKSLATDEVQLDVLRPFEAIPDGEFGSLASLLPQTEIRTSVPDLAEVLVKILELDEFDEYSPGTLLVMPVTNDLMGASKLEGALGQTLRSLRIKPLLLFPEESPDLAAATSFLQQSGARFIAKNDTAGPLNYASMAATDEIYAFVDNTYQNDHAIVKIDNAEVASSDSYSSQLWYEESITQHRLAVLTTTGNINDLELQYVRYGDYATCDETNYCLFTDDAIVFKRSSLQAANFPGQAWHLQVVNNGAASAEITLTRSIMNFVQETEQELSVDVWSSDGRGPVAYLPQNARFVLYASVSNRGMQVLSSNINVLVDVDVQRPDQELEHIIGQHLLDNGTLGDLRKDDSVFSGYLADDIFEDGTVVTVKAVTIASHTIRGELSPDLLALQQREASAASARLFTGVPEHEECCGSFVQSPNSVLNHDSRGFYLHLPDPIPPIEVNRIVVVPPTTDALPTTTSPATAATTPTTVVPSAMTTPTAATPPSTTALVTEVPTNPSTGQPAVSSTTQDPPMTAGVAPLETSPIKVVLQTAVALYLATLMR